MPNLRVCLRLADNHEADGVEGGKHTNCSGNKIMSVSPLSLQEGRKICVVRCTRVRTPRPHCSFHVAMRFLLMQVLVSVIHSTTTKLANIKYLVRIRCN